MKKNSTDIDYSKISELLKDEWINALTTVPSNNGVIIVAHICAFDDGGYFVASNEGCYDPDSDTWYVGEGELVGYEVNNVVAWMPMPMYRMEI